MNLFLDDSLISIIMPSYNTGRYIKESIESVIVQTYSNWELIIVDDCSTDNTDEVIMPLLEDKRVRYLKNEHNSGAAISRNRALREARGRWIAFLDSDDVWMPDKLEKQVTFMEENECAFSYHAYEKIDEGSHPLGILVTGPSIITKQAMYRYGYPGCLTVMYNAEEIGLVQIADIKKNNDYAMWLQICKKASCLFLPENLAQYRIRKMSISHDKFGKKLRSHYDLFRLCDGKSALESFWYASWNLFFGAIKKIRYEKNRRKVSWKFGRQWKTT